MKLDKHESYPWPAQDYSPYTDEYIKNYLHEAMNLSQEELNDKIIKLVRLAQDNVLLMEIGIPERNRNLIFLNTL